MLGQNTHCAGRFKLDPQSTECHLLGYASGSGNYKVQDVTSRRVFVSWNVVFEEGLPCRTAGVGEQTQISLFNTLTPPADIADARSILADHVPDQPSVNQFCDEPVRLIDNMSGRTNHALTRTNNTFFHR